MAGVQFLFDTAAVTAVTLAWYYRSKQQPHVSGNRSFAQLMALVGCTYLAVAFAVLTEMNAAKAPAVVAISHRLVIGHLLVGSVSFVLAAFGKGRVRVTTMIAAVMASALWLVYSLLGH